MSRARLSGTSTDNDSLLQRHCRDEILYFRYQLAVACRRRSIVDVEERLHVTQFECQLSGLFIEAVEWRFVSIDYNELIEQDSTMDAFVERAGRFRVFSGMWVGFSGLSNRELAGCRLEQADNPASDASQQKQTES